MFAQGVSDDAGSPARADKAQDQPKPDNTPPILDAIKSAVESVASSLVAQSDEAAAKRKEEHEARDLESQRDQAFWAMWMFFAAAAQTVLTFIGIVLLLRTLKYTKDAAGAARDMVVEGEKATAAAMSAAVEAKRQADHTERSFRRLERPYLFLIITEQVYLANPGGGMEPSIAYTLANYGKTPAILRSVYLELTPFTNVHFTEKGKPRVPAGVPKVKWYEVIPPGEQTRHRRINVTGPDVKKRYPPRTIDLALHGLIEYEDPTKALHFHHFVMVRSDDDFVQEYSLHHTEYPKEAET